MSSVLLESRPFRPFKSSEEYLEAMKEDLAEWLQTMYPHLNIAVDNFMEKLETGVALCEVSFFFLYCWLMVYAHVNNHKPLFWVTKIWISCFMLIDQNCRILSFFSSVARVNKHSKKQSAQFRAGIISFAPALWDICSLNQKNQFCENAPTVIRTELQNIVIFCHLKRTLLQRRNSSFCL